MKLVVNLKAGTRLAEIPTIIVADTIRPVLIITLSNNNNEYNSIVRVLKLALLNFYNSN